MNRDCALCVSWWPSQTMYIYIRASTEVTLLSSFKKARWMKKIHLFVMSVLSIIPVLVEGQWGLYASSSSHPASFSFSFHFFLSFSFLCFHGHERACLECFLSKVACLCMFFVFIHRKSVSEKSVLEKKQIALECKNSLVWFHMNLTLHANTFTHTWMKK